MHQALGQGGAGARSRACLAANPQARPPGIAGASPQGQSVPPAPQGWACHRPRPAQPRLPPAHPRSLAAPNANHRRTNGVTDRCRRKFVGVASKIKKPSLSRFEQGVTLFPVGIQSGIPTKTARPAHPPVGPQAPGLPDSRTVPTARRSNGTAPPNPNGQQAAVPNRNRPHT